MPPSPSTTSGNGTESARRDAHAGSAKRSAGVGMLRSLGGKGGRGSGFWYRVRSIRSDLCGGQGKSVRVVNHSRYTQIARTSYATRTRRMPWLWGGGGWSGVVCVASSRHVLDVTGRTALLPFRCSDTRRAVPCLCRGVRLHSLVGPLLINQSHGLARVCIHWARTRRKYGYKSCVDAIQIKSRAPPGSLAQHSGLLPSSSSSSSSLAQ